MISADRSSRFFTVWVTRDESHGGPLSAALEGVGLSPVVERTVRRAPLSTAPRLIACEPGDWLVLTSAYVLGCVRFSRLDGVRVAVVGEPTAAAARSAGLSVELVGSAGAQRLFGALGRRLCAQGGGRVVYPRSAHASVPALGSGTDLYAPAVYDTSAIPFDRTVAARVFAVVFTSPTTVRSVVGRLGVSGTPPAVSLGSTTTAALEVVGLAPVAEASSPTFHCAAAAAACYAHRSRHRFA